MADIHTTFITDEIVAPIEATTSTPNPAPEAKVLPDKTALTKEEVLLDEELTEELIIEDFTIDGICGVY